MRKSLKRLLAALTILAMAAPCNFAQVTGPIDPAGGAQPEPISEIPAAKTPLESTVPISLEFEDVSLSAVMKALSEQTGINFVAGEKVRDRRVTLYLTKVTLKEALDTILKATGLTYEQVGPNLFIISESGMPDVNTVTRVYPLNYAQAGERKEKVDDTEVTTPGLETVIKNLLSEHGSYVVDQRTNSIVVTDLPTKQESVERVVAQLDTKTPQIMIETEILETGAELTRDLGFRWGSGSAGSLFTVYGGMRQTFWPFSGGPLGTERSIIAPATGTTPMSWISATAPSGITSGLANFSQFQVILNALEKDTRTKVLGRPKILTLNNKSAEINILKKTAVASVTSVASGQGGTSTQATSQAERIETGVKLKVTPQVNKDDYITMVVEPSVTTVAESQFFQPTTNAVSGSQMGFLDPTTRSAKTTVMVRDGETVVIGGLITTEDSNTVRKVPVLGDIPILGLFFREKTRSKTDKELVVFLTPHIVREEMASISGVVPALRWESAPPPPAAPTHDKPAEFREAEEPVPARVEAPKKVLLEREQEIVERDEVIERTIKGLE